MDRLTRKFSDGTPFIPNEVLATIGLKGIAEKLTEYEDLEERGLLLKLSAPAGKDLVKALHCLASQHTNGDCYMEHYNMLHLDNEECMLMRCGEYEGFICCPYYQSRYGVWFEGGECSEWLKTLADLLN